MCCIYCTIEESRSEKQKIDNILARISEDKRLRIQGSTYIRCDVSGPWSVPRVPDQPLQGEESEEEESYI